MYLFLHKKKRSAMSTKMPCEICLRLPGGLGSMCVGLPFWPPLVRHIWKYRCVCMLECAFQSTVLHSCTVWHFTPYTHIQIHHIHIYNYSPAQIVHLFTFHVLTHTYIHLCVCMCKMELHTVTAHIPKHLSSSPIVEHKTAGCFLVKYGIFFYFPIHTFYSFTTTSLVSFLLYVLRFAFNPRSLTKR